MKKIKIKKGSDLSAKSRIKVITSSGETILQGYGYYPFTINIGETITLKQLWTRGKYNYDELEDNCLYTLKPRLGSSLAIIVFILFIATATLFSITLSLFSLIPFLLMMIYIGLYLTLLRNHYLYLRNSDKS